MLDSGTAVLILIIISVAAFFGVLARRHVEGYGFGLIGNTAVGAVGAVIGLVLAKDFSSEAAGLLFMVIGAIAALLAIGLLKRRG